MTDWTDDVARILATPMPRRSAFKLLSGVLGGALLGVRRGAAQPECTPACKKDEQCCGTECAKKNEQCCPSGRVCKKKEICCSTAPFCVTGTKHRCSSSEE